MAHLPITPLGLSVQGCFLPVQAYFGDLQCSGCTQFAWAMLFVLHVYKVNQERSMKFNFQSSHLTLLNLFNVLKWKKSTGGFRCLELRRVGRKLGKGHQLASGAARMKCKDCKQKPVKRERQ